MVGLGFRVYFNFAVCVPRILWNGNFYAVFVVFSGMLININTVLFYFIWYRLRKWLYCILYCILIVKLSEWLKGTISMFLWKFHIFIATHFCELEWFFCKVLKLPEWLRWSIHTFLFSRNFVDLQHGSCLKTLIGFWKVYK